MDYNMLSRQIYDNNVAVGWWDGEPCIYTKLQLISTEVAEATEGERKNLMDDHLPHRKMGEVELADALIRTLDLGGKLNLWYLDSMIGFHYAKNTKMTVGNMHLRINSWIIRLYGTYENDTKAHNNSSYTGLINTIVNTSNALGYDIKNAMADKLKYNQTRLDHKKVIVIKLTVRNFNNN